MNFTEPLPLTELLERLGAKTPIGSVMRTAGWERMPQELRDSAFFSAGVTSAQFLAAQKKQIGALIARARETNAKGETMWQTDRARFVAEMRQMGAALGVAHPDGPRAGGIKEKDVRDPLSLARLQLIVNTQLEMAYGRGQYATAMNEDILSEWPAWELVRITPRKAPRDWPRRWAEAGGVIHDGRMIALKTSPVWSKISRFGHPHPPFDFNSGMGVEEIDRDTAESLGLLGAEDVLEPDLSAAQPPPKATVPKSMQPALKRVFKQQIEFDGETATFSQGEPGNDDLVKVREAKAAPPRAPEKLARKPRRADVLEATPSRKDGSAPETLAQVVKEPSAGKGLKLEPRRPTREEAGLINLLNERAWGYDEQGNIIDFVDGEGRKIEQIPEHLRRPGFTVTHNHPDGDSFSEQDVFMTAANNLKELRVIGHQGRSRRYLYRLRFDPAMSHNERMAAVNVYSDKFAEVAKESAKAIEDGALTAAEFRRSRAHWTMQRVSDELRGRVKYERIHLP